MATAGGTYKDNDQDSKKNLNSSDPSMGSRNPNMGKSTENRSDMSGSTKEAGYGKDEKSSDTGTPNRSENWTGNEERLYTGSGAGKGGQGQQSMRAIAGRGGNAAEDIWQAGQEAVENTVGQFGERAKQFTSKARDLASNVTDRASEAGEYVTSAVKNNPIQSLLIGFGVGCLVGVLATSATRR